MKKRKSNTNSQVPSSTDIAHDLGARFNLRQEIIDHIDLDNWRDKFNAVTSARFDDDRKKVFLFHYAETGKINLAAKQAGVSQEVVRAHRKKDVPFAILMSEIADVRAEIIVDRIETEAIEGHISKSYDKDGNVVNEKRVYETRLRERILARYDQSYINKKQVDVNVKSGVLVAPTTLSPEDWISAALETQRKQQEMIQIDAEVVESSTNGEVEGNTKALDTGKE